MSRQNPFEKILSPVYLTVNSGQCLRLRHKKSRCRLCLENCPSGAVTCERSLEIDYSRCSGCGICVNLCPTGVFELKDLPYESLLVPVRESSQVKFTCSSLPQENDGIRVPCLGYLDATVLTGAIADGSQAVQLNITGCKECRRALGLRAAVKSLRQANRILALFGIPRKISASAGEPGSARNPGNGGLYSRREFFSYLRGKTRSRVAAAIDRAESDREAVARTKVTLEPRLPKKRVLLLEHIKKLGQPVAARVRAGELPFAVMEIGDRCNGCGICVTFCPTGALRASDQGDRQVIDFGLRDCLDCGLCGDVCPEDAITSSAWINPSDLVTDSRKILVEHRKSVCTRCGQTYLAVSGSDLCLNCRKKKEIEEWLVSTWQQS